MDTLKHEKSYRVSLCDGMAQIRSEIGGTSRKQIFKIKDPAPALNRGRKSIYLDSFDQRSLSRLILRFFAYHGHNS